MSLRCAVTQLAGSARRRAAHTIHSNAVASATQRTHTARPQLRSLQPQPSASRWIHTVPPRCGPSVTAQTHPPPPSSPFDIAAAAAEGASMDPEPVMPTTAQSDAAAAPADSTSSAAAAADATPPSPPLPAPLFLRMPAVEGTGRMRLLRWHVAVGAAFAQGAVLADIDSALAVIEFKAQVPGVMGLLRKRPGAKIVPGEIIAVQVGSAAEVAHASAWLAHVERLARRERAERMEAEAKEEAEEDALEEIEQMQQEQEAAASEAAAVAAAADAQSADNSSTPDAANTKPQNST